MPNPLHRIAVPASAYEGIKINWTESLSPTSHSTVFDKNHKGFVTENVLSTTYGLDPTSFSDCEKGNNGSFPLTSTKGYVGNCGTHTDKSHMDWGWPGAQR